MHRQIQKQIQEAMKAKDTVRLSTLRGLLSAFINELVAEGRKPSEILSDDEALAVTKRAVKQRRDSIEQFRCGGREDLASKEEAEMKILEIYLPAQMSREDIRKVVLAKKEEMGVSDKSKMGILMSAVMKELKNKADGKDVKDVLESLFE